MPRVLLVSGKSPRKFESSCGESSFETDVSDDGSRSPHSNVSSFYNESSYGSDSPIPNHVYPTVQPTDFSSQHSAFHKPTLHEKYSEFKIFGARNHEDVRNVSSPSEAIVTSSEDRFHNEDARMEHEECENEKNVFYRADPTIPFALYLENLVNIFRQNMNKINEESNLKMPVKSELSPPPAHIIPARPIIPNFSLPIYNTFPLMQNYNIGNAPSSSTPIGHHLSHSHRPQHQPMCLSSPDNSPSPPAPVTRTRRDMTGKTPCVKKYKCDVCGKAFSRSNTLVTHKRIHTGAKPFACEICGRAFRQPGNLTRHRLTHTTVKPYVCPHCHKAFNRASNLHTHIRTHATYKTDVRGVGYDQDMRHLVHSHTC